MRNQSSLKSTVSPRPSTVGDDWASIHSAGRGNRPTALAVAGPKPPNTIGLLPILPEGVAGQPRWPSPGQSRPMRLGSYPSYREGLLSILPEGVAGQPRWPSPRQSRPIRLGSYPFCREGLLPILPGGASAGRGSRPTALAVAASKPPNTIGLLPILPGRAPTHSTGRGFCRKG